MDFPKLLHLIASRKLYFCRADLLPDPWEGALGTLARKPEWDSYFREYFRQSVRTPPKGYAPPSDEEAEKQALRLFQEFQSNPTERLRWTFISCWHENEGESEAMWRLYAAYLRNAVAIRTTVGRLLESLDDDPDVDVGRVKYTDYNKQFIGGNPFYHKRLSFSHEREVRAVVSPQHRTDSSGLLKPIDVEVLIETVHLSPQAPEWFVFVVNNALSRYNIKAPVHSSALSDIPFF